MISICPIERCTGCGMCSNICPKSAISMEIGVHDFVFPKIDSALCVDCGLCKNACPSNKVTTSNENVLNVYAAWNKNKKIRSSSTSGGIFSVISKNIINHGGVVVGVAWNKEYHPYHVIIDNEKDLSKLQGSKYSQSITSDIYKKVKDLLVEDRKVLFSGTPCQNAALHSYLGRDYDNLYLIDVVCHGVPSNKMLDKYYSQFDDVIKDVKLRYKDPYWDYTYVKIVFDNNSCYKQLTIYDPYFNLFNVGYSLRSSCHTCMYANTHRQSDITLADFWGFTAHSFATRNYNLGTSLVLINSRKGIRLFEEINDDIFFEESSIEVAKNGNKCLSEPFIIDNEELNCFWQDYESGMSVDELNNKYCANAFSLPKKLELRRMYHKWKWIIGR